MGLYGSSSNVDEIVGKFPETKFEVQNGIVTSPRPYSLFAPKQPLSTPASSDDDIRKSITSSIDFKNKEKLCDFNAIAKSSAAPQYDNSKEQLAVDNFHLGKSETEFVSSDLNVLGVQTHSHNCENVVESQKPNGTDAAPLPNLQTDIANRKVQDNLRMFCAVDDEFDADFRAGISERNIRYYTITKVLRKIRRDLITMRIEDNRLARHLLETRSQMNILKLTQSCDKHAEMLDDVAYELEEEDMLPGLIKACDLPSRPPGSLLSAFSPLRNIGVSRMNLNRRRFSIR